MTESKRMKSYLDYKCSSEKLKVGTYEVNQLAGICGINVYVLIYLGARATSSQTPVAIKDGWYIYALEERNLRGETKYYITIDNCFKYL